MNFKKLLLAASIALASATAFAAVDVNKASQAELESVKGIGVASSTRILDERKKAPFKDWSDLVDRVRGIGPGNATRFSNDGLTVNGAAFNAGAAPTRTAGQPARDGAKASRGSDAAPGEKATMKTPAKEAASPAK